MNIYRTMLCYQLNKYISVLVAFTYLVYENKIQSNKVICEMKFVCQGGNRLWIQYKTVIIRFVLDIKRMLIW